ncbi:MAG TPA: galactokinase [Deltaproteobacteria bacterium]|nr:MAG: hypothetical protein A2Z79_08425 [Deltaproteobacteria bacterium GWA2_55_82]OGQ63144.1 MAG: hypothetical protein A3I81_10055 [Deltaproteobacteria bacterium RIFCSPLOWO2_02_FULL_55_12]OIJ73609.1 MAG: hypothetical protein A2V21_304620 [Deltaproteobacteria bacterium GWC2_55_46]HBG47746.1 galactokinase [Deltaproteobacteria bacterium]HCY12032.1 galactokinase [Deltaproteobacteria bacterium]
MTEAVILAGGLGTRLKSAVPDLPKPLAEVNGRPFLDLLLKQLDSSGVVGRVVLAVGYRAEKIIERYANASGYSFELVFSREDEPLGTGGALIKAGKLTGSSELLVLNGDSYVEADIADLLSFHRESGSPFTMVLKEAADCRRYGRVEVNAESRIVSFGEKEQRACPGLINAGVYVFERPLIEDERVRPLSLETALLPGYLRYGGYGYIVYGRFIDIGLPETYRSAQEYLKGM